MVKGIVPIGITCNNIHSNPIPINNIIARNGCVRAKATRIKKKTTINAKLYSYGISQKRIIYRGHSFLSLSLLAIIKATTV